MTIRRGLRSPSTCATAFCNWLRRRTTFCVDRAAKGRLNGILAIPAKAARHWRFPRPQAREDHQSRRGRIRLGSDQKICTSWISSSSTASNSSSQSAQVTERLHTSDQCILEEDRESCPLRWRSTICITISSRIHQTLRVTPAMAAGITDHVWGNRRCYQLDGLTRGVEISSQCI